jgi:selenocysteine-specific elongation factor
MARVRALGGVALAPAAAGLVQLRLEEAVVAGRADRVVVRSYSPATTIGGALVLDPLPPKRRRADLQAVERLRAAGDDLPEVAARMLEGAGPRGLDLGALVARLTVPAARVAEALAARPDVVALGEPPTAYLGRAALGRLVEAAARELERFHKAQPLKPAMPREELRRRACAGAPPAAFALVLAELETRGAVRLGTDAVALAGHRVTLNPAEQEARAALLREALAAGLAGLDPDTLAGRLRGQPAVLEGVTRVLVDEGALRRVGGFLVHHAALEELMAEVRQRWPPGSRLDVAGFKELTGLTRKFVIPLLEFLDRERVTRRAGNDRLVLA